MIQASELMLGNYIYHNSEINKIIVIKEERITICGIDENPYYLASIYSEAYPIPITEEILLKVGFKEDKDWDIKCFIMKCNDFSIFFEKHSSGWSLSLPGLASVMVEHLHTAQNLILILTGKELKIEL